MVLQYLTFLLQLIPEYFDFLDALLITGSVSWLGLTVAVICLGTLIGAFLMRV